jgi:two-component system, chemotaxis family, response regulator Rcp1
MSEPLRTKAIDILLVEDNAGDVRLTREALKDGKVPNSLHVAGDGVEALAFLRHTGPYASAPPPDIILLDLNLPRMDGREVLAEIKKDSALQCIPVVILTTSSAAEDVNRAYSLHANCFITKPVGLAQFFKVIQSLEEFWFTTVRLPAQI